MNERKKRLISIFCVFSIILIVFGVTYSIFTYTKQGETENTVTTGKLTFLYTENTGTGTGINITNAFPVSDELGKAYSNDDQVFDFKVESEIVGEAQIPYEVTVKKLESSTLDEAYIKLYLTDTTETEEASLLEPIKFNMLPTSYTNEDEKQIYFDVVESNENYLKKFRLRMWIDDGTDQDEISNKSFTIKVGVYSPAEKMEKKVICKRATSLHTDICNNASSCGRFGSSTGATVTFGNLGIQGILSSGDAFDCDVNGDKTYDPETERFYYVIDLDSDTAVLIYYSNTTAGVPDLSGRYMYDTDYANYLGPQIAMEQLPTTVQWKNIKLKKPVRNITDELGIVRVENYSYDGYAARFLTTQEVEQSCNITVGNRTTNELSNCRYLLENTHYLNSSYTNYWLENPKNESSYYAWNINGWDIAVNAFNLGVVSGFGSRPAIEIEKKYIEY